MTIFKTPSYWRLNRHTMVGCLFRPLRTNRLNRLKLSPS